MKRKIVLLGVILLVLVLIPLFWLGRGGTGWPVMRHDPGTLSTEQTRQVFRKWQDAEGRWHFSDEVPDGVATIDVEIDTAANIIQSVKPPAPVSPSVSAEPARPVPGIPMTVNPADIPKLLESAKQVEQQMNQRQQQLDAAR